MGQRYKSTSIVEGGDQEITLNIPIKVKASTFSHWRGHHFSDKDYKEYLEEFKKTVGPEIAEYLDSKHTNTWESEDCCMAVEYEINKIEQ